MGDVRLGDRHFEDNVAVFKANIKRDRGQSKLVKHW